MYTPFALHIHPFEIDIATVSIDLVSIYIDLVSERTNLTFASDERKNERANLIFAFEKTREYSAFSLTKKAFVFDSLLKRRREDRVLFH